MENLQVFDNGGLGIKVRTILNEDGSISVSAEDAAVGFGWVQMKNGASYPRWETVNGYCADLGFPNKLGKDDYIPESIFYLLGMKANNDKAREFQRWIAVEVLPSIRKHGMYAVDQLLADPDLAIKAFTALKEEREKRKLLETENAQQKQIIGELKPRADYTDFILKNKGLVTITQIAKDYGMSGQVMNDKLHSLGVQYKASDQWLLYAKHHDKGYTHSNTIPIVHSDGQTRVKMQTKWTQKGRLFIYNLLKAEGILPVIEQERQGA